MSIFPSLQYKALAVLTGNSRFTTECLVCGKPVLNHSPEQIRRHLDELKEKP